MSRYKYSGAVKIPFDEIRVSYNGNDYDWVEPFAEVAISKVIYSEPVTIVMWDDGTKTVSKCANGDVYSKETGLTICLLKKIMGATPVHRIFEDWVTQDNEVTISDVRKKHKNK